MSLGKGVGLGGWGLAKKVTKYEIDMWKCSQKSCFKFSFLVQFNICSSVTNEALVMLQWASIERLFVGLG